jgi:hypothetical protein
MFLQLLNFANDLDFVPVEEVASIIPTEPIFIIIGLILIGLTIFIIFFLKKFIINSILGLGLWLIVTFVFNVNLPTIPSLVISIVIGPAGLGTMLLLNAFGLLAV